MVSRGRSRTVLASASKDAPFAMLPPAFIFRHCRKVVEESGASPESLEPVCLKRSKKLIDTLVVNGTIPRPRGLVMTLLADCEFLADNANERRLLTGYVDMPLTCGFLCQKHSDGTGASLTLYVPPQAKEYACTGAFEENGTFTHEKCSSSHKLVAEEALGMPPEPLQGPLCADLEGRLGSDTRIKNVPNFCAGAVAVPVHEEADQTTQTNQTNETKADGPFDSWGKGKSLTAPAAKEEAPPPPEPPPPPSPPPPPPQETGNGNLRNFGSGSSTAL